MELSNQISSVEKPSQSNDDDDPEADPDSSNKVPGADSVADVSDRSLEISLFDGQDDSAESLYVYKNVFSLLPRSVGGFRGLKTLKFFANEIEVFPSEVGDWVELECLQVKVASPALSGLALRKMAALKELELCHVPPRPSAFSILSDIAVLKSLTKLSICHFSIRYLPPEIGCLKKLEDLDLSFNKLKNLPDDIAALTALKSLRVANNKLVELPLGLSCLQRLKNLDLSNNRLTSLGSLSLDSMHTLQNLNLQYNKLLHCCQIPSWICCNLEGNGKDTANDEFISSLVEVDVVDAAIDEVDASRSCSGCRSTSSPLLSESSSSSRSSAARRMKKGWKRRDYLQQKARQERLNTSRKWRSEDRCEAMTRKKAANGNPCKEPLVESRASESQYHINEEKQSCCRLESSPLAEDELGIVRDLNGDECELAVEHDSQILLGHDEDNDRNVSDKGYYGDDCSCIVDSVCVNKEHEYDCNDEHNASSARPLKKNDEQDGESSSEVPKNMPKSKRHSDRDLDSPKPRKFRRPVDECLNFSCKYSTESFCSSNDHMPDGFYDAGRDRPFMPLRSYDQSPCPGSREVILVDRETDEELDAIALTAQVLASSLKLSRSSLEEKEQFSVDLRRASVLALFVSNCFGGCDRSNSTAMMRKAVAGSNYQKPFICTCSTGNSYNDKATSNQIDGPVESFSFIDLCEKSLRFVKQMRNSNVVPIGSVRFGVCRHRAVLMKYLCDRADPPIPCELVRGYLDFMPHAWNVILIRKGESLVRLVVDACHPTDIREETDVEYFCRYIPLTRVQVPVSTENIATSEYTFPSVSPGIEAEEAASGSVIQCKFGTKVVAAKLRTLEAYEASEQEMKKFEYSCLGEVRILNVLRNHDCIVEIYGHRLSSKWIPQADGNKGHRLLQSTIMMEYIGGGSLKNHIKRLSEGGEKHVPINTALFIARDIASALAEVHSKHIIHRDVKSENILIDLDNKRINDAPIVKLCDFDSAVPLQASLHTCCIAHLGIPPPDVCVGTPRWMAPEVLQAMHTRNRYGLEVDIWSYGCVLLEMLTLQVPYAGLLDSKIHHLLQSNQRPQLTNELEALDSSDESTMTGSDSASAAPSEAEAQKFLIDLFRECTKGNPADRPTARQIYDRLCCFISSRSAELNGSRSATTD
ncbi:uncharacterized protein LOC131248899 [Magnolia sinica]|uniref:uncharacterized protein LOC131248899 n=1 Tax=Magnolia sinica TaxID=86752 RepID=UPI00265A9E7F|nr:uncharacterized protein LOC131248899 [Magnolia sinica]